MASTLICKITHGTEIRRFTIRYMQPEDITYASVHKRASHLFGLSESFSLRYKDDEGDAITMSTDDEMHEAVMLAISMSPSILRLSTHFERACRDTSPTETSPNAQNVEAPPPQDAPADVTAFMKNLQKSLPSLMSQLPAAVRDLLPLAELDVAATLAATKAATTNACDDRKEAVHWGVTCDVSGQSPIIGSRYHLQGEDYDLCEVEFRKLPPAEQAKYIKMPPPAAPQGIHPNVTCDRSGQHPIVGNRYNLPGHNYDLCEAEFLKLSSNEQAKFVKIPPPSANAYRCPGRAFARGCRTAGDQQLHGCSKLAARFVRDVSIFDGTQMAPNTRFTKIWRLKNVGEIAWPPGTKLLFVGGDQMSAETMVAINSEKLVQPNDEVDVAVDMTAPQGLGRYLGYWRLTGPHGRRRFGQRMWCHIQVVDPATPPPALEDDFQKATNEINSLMAASSDGVDEPDEAEPSEVVRVATDSHDAKDMAEMAAIDADVEMKAVKTEPEARSAAEADPIAMSEKQAESTPIHMSQAASVSDEKAAGVVDGLLAMGFADKALIETVIEKNGPDLVSCARDLISLNEWDSMLDELAEMGFEDRHLNKKLMVKNNGSIKRTVKDLVTDA